MTIGISTDELLHRIRTASHDELEALVPEPEQRYHMEASAEKEDAIRQCMDYAYARVLERFSRFLDTDDSVRDSELAYGRTIHPGQYVFAFATTERRMSGREDALRDAAATLLRDRALGKFYQDNGQAELAAKWNAASQTDEEALMRLMYRKRPPKIMAY